MATVATSLSLKSEGARARLRGRAPFFLPFIR
jgi:hypothetical protein